MSRLVSKAESWERVYESFENINFAAFDYNTIKQSLLEYIRLNFPESFNDMIESSEFIAIVETFAYIAEQIAYRIDVGAHENFISTAQRRDSILRLAKLVSYTASRPLPARGLVKITSVSTTESVLDANGNDLAGTTIRWNDSSNPNWKDQFILLMNRVMDQEFGSVGPNDRFQIQDVLFEVYGVGLIPQPNGVLKYNVNVNGSTVPMELVPIEYDSSLGIIERRPQVNANFTWMYATDGLGDNSETTGFLCFTKQGSLQRFRTSFDGVTPNQWYDVPATNVNDTDVWLNNVNSTTGETLDLPNPFSFRPSWYGKSGEWVQVDLAYSQNVIFNTNPNRNKYEVETRDQNRVRLIFGDGEYADVPSGSFDVWVRTSLNEDVVIPQSSVVNVPVSFTYVDSFGRIQTFSFTFTLVGSLQNASAAETDEHVRITAPAVYYTQDRMVNAQDYNTFMLQDPSILKLRSINRTFAGDSKYMNWHDGSESYENVKIYGDDGYLYFQERPVEQIATNVTFDSLVSNYVEPLLSSTDIMVQLTYAGVPYGQRRTYFTTQEKTDLLAALTAPPSPVAAKLYYNIDNRTWYAIKESDDPNSVLVNSPADYVFEWVNGVKVAKPLITVTQDNITPTTYVVQRQARRLVFESPTTSFWSTNGADSVIDYDTVSSTKDSITVLKANVNCNRDGVLQQNWLFDVVGQEVIDAGAEIGLTDINRLSILPQDVNGDNLPDNLDPDDTVFKEGVADIINCKVEIPAGPSAIGTMDVPIYYVGGEGDVRILGDVEELEIGVHWNEIVDGNNIGKSIEILSFGDNNPAGYQEVDVGGVAVGDVTGLTNDATVYTATVVVDGGASQHISVVGSAAQTYTTLLTELNAGTTGAIWSLNSDGNLQCTSSTTGPTSTIEIDKIGGDLFQSLATYVSINPSVPCAILTIMVNDYVYFSRASTLDNWIIQPTTYDAITSYVSSVTAADDLWKRHNGRDQLNFAWFHYTSRYYLVDPAPSNIIDTFIITRGYYTEIKRWLEDPLAAAPSAPTPMTLRTSYGYLLDNKMISDTVVLHPGRFKLLFGSKAPSELQATFKIIRSPNGVLTDNQVKTTVVSAVRNFFDVGMWEFGETFFYTELSAAIHAALPTEISSVVLVPRYTTNQFGDLFQVLAREDEIFYPDITVDQVEIVSGYNATNLRLNG